MWAPTFMATECEVSIVSDMYTSVAFPKYLGAGAWWAERVFEIKDTQLQGRGEDEWRSRRNQSLRPRALSFNVSTVRKPVKVSSTEESWQSSDQRACIEHKTNEGGEKTIRGWIVCWAPRRLQAVLRRPYGPKTKGTRRASGRRLSMSSPYRGDSQPYAANSNPYLYPPQSSTFSTPNLDPASSTAHLVAPGKSPLASARTLARTPSPTPSEAAELAREGALDWKRLRNWRFWIRREWLWYYVLTAVIVAVVALVTIFHTKIVEYLKPAATFLKDLPAGWLIPVGILFVISFPPLFGHEIIAVLCGIVWGLGIGFAIVCAGTFIGEVGNFYAFRWCCRARGEKLEKTNITYGVLARVVREGGFKIALVARLSAIPGHFTTAVFSSCGMGIFVFSLAALLSLPKQFVTVYLGVLIDTSDSETTAQRLASYAVVGVTVAITALAMWYIYREMNRLKPAYIYDRRKARGAKLAMGSSGAPYDGASPYVAEPGMSAVNVSLHAPEGSYSPRDPNSQQWDSSGRAVGSTPNPAFIRQPAPQHGRVPTFRTEGGGGYDSNGRRYEEGVDGAVYPVSPRADGRMPVRQASDSDDSFETAHDQSRQPSEAHHQSAYPPSYHTHQPPHQPQQRSPWEPVSVSGPFPRVDFGPPPSTPTHPYGRASHVQPQVQAPQQYQMREMQPQQQSSPYVSPQHTAQVPRSTSPPPINTTQPVYTPAAYGAPPTSPGPGSLPYPGTQQPTYAGAHPVSPSAYAPSSPALPYPGHGAGSQPSTPTQGAPGFAQQQYFAGAHPSQSGTPTATQYSQFAGQQQQGVYGGQQQGHGHDPYGSGASGQEPYNGYGYAQ
ncbi:hypothetical protein PENSPDRAFT_707259 [Peniophora sp. CONT]|nr:hypothetical protein PENSPDRAFT_707259 [Peniophora sp. CONT]